MRMKRVAEKMRRLACRQLARDHLARGETQETCETFIRHYLLGCGWDIERSKTVAAEVLREVRDE